MQRLHVAITMLSAVLAVVACSVVVTRAGHPLPEAQHVAQLLQQGASRAQVLAALGPSDEYRTPRPIQSRQLEPLASRVVQDGRLLTASTLSYSFEHSHDRRFTLIPFLNFFSWRHEFRELDRLELRFDEAGRLVGAARRLGAGL